MTSGGIGKKEDSAKLECSIFALVAQWIEHPPPKGRVTGSTPVEGATF
jgi:hypothetical protein